MSRFSTPNPKKKEQDHREHERSEEKRVEQHKSDDELIDEAIDESFPASDPPGYHSKSSVDQDVHTNNQQ